MTRMKGFWTRASLAVFLGLFFSVLLLVLGRNPLYALILAILFGVWLTHSKSPSDGRIAGAFIGGILAVLLALISFARPAVIPPNPLLEVFWVIPPILLYGNSLIEALLAVLILTLVSAICGDVAIRFQIAYSQGRAPFF